MITGELARWLRQKADELDGASFPDILGGVTLKEVVGALSLAEEQFEISMSLKRKKTYGSSKPELFCSFNIEDETSRDFRGNTLLECYKVYLAGQDKLAPVEAAEAALNGVEQPF